MKKHRWEVQRKRLEQVQFPGNVDEATFEREERLREQIERYTQIDLYVEANMTLWQKLVRFFKQWEIQ